MATATAKPRKAPTKSTAKTGPDPILEAIGITALAKSAKADAHRDLLKPGLHAIDLSTRGTIDGQAWKRDIAGTLMIAPDSAPCATSSTPWEELLLSALCKMTAVERHLWLATVSGGAIPDPHCGPEKMIAVAAELEPALNAYRSTKQAPKRGTVSFTPAA